MCQSLAAGGQRCAAHTRPRYQTATFGTPAWDEAAAAYASTPTGRMELASSLAAAEAAGDIRSAVAFEHAIAEGHRLRDKAELFRDEMATRAAETAQPVEPAPTEPSGADYEPDDHDDDLSERDEFGDQFDDAPIGGWVYTDEEAWESNPGRDWSPRMVGQTWNRQDPVFAGCRETMSNNEFIDQVCTNTGITRAEFEAAAATYMGDREVLFVTSQGMTHNDTEGPHTHFNGVIDVSNARNMLAHSATPQYTPEQIAEIAAIAVNRRNKAAVRTDQTNQAPATSSARRTGVELPDDPDELARLSTSDDANVRAAVAAHLSTPTGVVDRLATADPKVEVRAAAARNDNISPDTLVALATDRSVKVRAGAARNPTMPSSNLSTLATDPNETVKGAVARNPSTPSGLYQGLAEDASPGVRKHAARRRDIPAAIASRLAADPDQTVRGTLAKNRTTSTTFLNVLATDEAQSVRAAAARNPNIDPVLLRGPLSRDQTAGVRAAVARNENTTLPVLTRLSTDPDPWVRRNIAWNQATPASLLYCLARDHDAGVRSSARDRV